MSETNEYINAVEKEVPGEFIVNPPVDEKLDSEFSRTVPNEISYFSLLNEIARRTKILECYKNTDVKNKHRSDDCDCADCLHERVDNFKELKLRVCPEAMARHIDKNVFYDRNAGGWVRCCDCFACMDEFKVVTNPPKNPQEAEANGGTPVAEKLEAKTIKEIVSAPSPVEEKPQVKSLQEIRAALNKGIINKSSAINEAEKKKKKDDDDGMAV